MSLLRGYPPVLLYLNRGVNNQPAWIESDNRLGLASLWNRTLQLRQALRHGDEEMPLHGSKNRCTVIRPAGAMKLEYQPQRVCGPATSHG